jgi:hypothetical protein
LSTVPEEVRAALVVARKFGVACDRPIVLAESMNAVVHLHPNPLVARVTRVAHLVRPVETLAGVVAMARALRGFVIQPSDQVDPGPHVEEGHYVTFWEYVKGVPATPAEVGSSLRALHQAARLYEGKLRSFDPRPEALQIADFVGGAVGGVLRAAAERMDRPELSEQPVHGDAHPGNVLAGGLWVDLDETCTGPPEWDIACLRHCYSFFGELEHETCEALMAYGLYDEEAVAALDPFVVLFTAAWGAMAPLIGEPIGSRTLRRLDWLRKRYVL